MAATNLKSRLRIDFPPLLVLLVLLVLAGMLAACNGNARFDLSIEQSDNGGIAISEGIGQSPTSQSGDGEERSESPPSNVQAPLNDYLIFSLLVAFFLGLVAVIIATTRRLD